MGTGNAADAALYFFQALRAYPNQSELATIYQKTLPEKTLAVRTNICNYTRYLISLKGCDGSVRA